MTETKDIIKRIATEFHKGNVVPIIGAGASTTQKDENGRKINGFPLATEFVKQMAKKHDFVKGTESFEACCALIENSNGVTVLQEELRKTFSPPLRLPTYEILSRFKFDTAVSFNFDESLCDALQKVNGSESVQFILADNDVPLGWHRPIRVIKPHGTVGRFETFRATRKRVGSFDTECPLVRSLIEVLLAGRTPLFIGYGFGDHDIVGALQRVQTWLGDNYRKGVAILRKVSKGVRAELDQLNIDVIEGDAVTELGKIAEEYEELEQMGPEDYEESESWRNNIFFYQLRRIRGRPTETQVIEALLKAAEEQMPPVRRVAREASEAADSCLKYRPLFASLKHVAQRLEFIAKRRTNKEAWNQWQDYKDQRDRVRRQIAKMSSKAIGKAKQVLLYSQSQRAIDLLRGLPPGRFRGIEIIIPECRAKSPSPFQNAILIAEHLAKDGFKSLRLVADVVGLHLIGSKKVDLVLMGVHEVFCLKDSEQPIAIVNSVGTEAVCAVAERAGVKVLFIYEDEKIVHVNSLQEARTDFEKKNAPECDLGATADLGKLAHNTKVKIEQLGYDFVEWRDNMEAIVGKKSK